MKTVIRFFSYIVIYAVIIIVLAVIGILMICVGSPTVQGRVLPTQARFYNAADTTRIDSILIAAAAARLDSPNERVAWLGRQFIGTPYVAHTLECDSTDGREYLTVNIGQLDCTTFVETVATMAITLGEGRTSWRDYVYNLERLRYRSGEMNGYASRLHYICDWVIDNSSRGLIKDVTDRFEPVRYCVKTIEFMSAHRDRYPMLADSTTFAHIRAIEDGYRGHRYPYLRSSALGNKAVMARLQSGDIVALTSSLKDLDVTHMGLIIKDDKGIPHLLHASSSLGKVVLSIEPLAEFMRRNRSLTGIRVLRVQ